MKTFAGGLSSIGWVNCTVEVEKLPSCGEGTEVARRINRDDRLCAAGVADRMTTTTLSPG